MSSSHSMKPWQVSSGHGEGDGLTVSSACLPVPRRALESRLMVCFASTDWGTKWEEHTDSLTPEAKHPPSTSLYANVTFQRALHLLCVLSMHRVQEPLLYKVLEEMVEVTVHPDRERERERSMVAMKLPTGTNELQGLTGMIVGGLLQYTRVQMFSLARTWLQVKQGVCARLTTRHTYVNWDVCNVVTEEPGHIPVMVRELGLHRRCWDRDGPCVSSYWWSKWDKCPDCDN